MVPWCVRPARPVLVTTKLLLRRSRFSDAYAWLTVDLTIRNTIRPVYHRMSDEDPGYGLFCKAFMQKCAVLWLPMSYGPGNARVINLSRGILESREFRKRVHTG